MKHFLYISKECFIMRICKRCELEKEIGEFPHCNGKPNSYYCKECFYTQYHKTSVESSRKYRENNPEKCKETKSKYLEKNKEVIKLKLKDYYEKNKDFLLAKNKEYCKNNRESRNENARKNYHINNQKEKKKEYVNEKLNTDPFFKMKFNIRSLIRNSVKRCFTEKSKKTIEILGCAFDEFKLHLESQFDENMCWENHGTYWHMDHIIPISSAQNEEEVYKLNHYTNFQPLYWEDNLRKSNKMP